MHKASIKTLTLHKLSGMGKKPAICGLFFLALLASGAVLAQQTEKKTGYYPGAVRFASVIGLTEWDSANDLEPVGGGGFDSDGINWEFSLHAVAWSTRYGDLLVGGDHGVFSNSGAGFIPELSGLSARGFYLTPSVKWRFGEYGHLRTHLEAGAGYYKIDISDVDYFGGDDIWKERTVGGYLGVSFDFPLVLAYLEPTVGLKVHFFDAGAAGGLGPNAGDLTGPVYMLQFGFAMSHYE
jgi:hypothetical protein